MRVLVVVGMSAVCVDDEFEDCMSPELFEYVRIEVVRLYRCTFNPVESTCFSVRLPK